MRQAAKHDLHTTEGLAQVQHLRFILPSGEIDTQYNGMTVRGGVLDDGILEMPGSEVIDGRCALQLPRLAAGCHRYDVLISGDGTDNPLLAGVIHVAPRVTPVDGDDNAPADYLDIVIPEDEGGTITVISESPAWVDDAVEQSLQKRGMYVSPATGSSTLATGEAETPTLLACYAMDWGDELLAGHLTDQCRLRSVTMIYYTDAGQTGSYWLRVWRLDGGKYVVAGLAPAVPLPAINQPMTWVFTPGVPLRRGDKIMLELCMGADADHLTTHELGLHAVITAVKDGRGIASAVSYPPVITQSTIAPVLSVAVDYDDGVMVGGVELATAAQMQGLGNDVRTASADAQAAATAATTASNQAQTAATNAGTSATNAASSATAAQQALDAIPQVDAAGNMTLAGGLTTAATINANGGINIPVAPSMDTQAARFREVQLLQEMEFSPLRTYFKSPDPVPFGVLLDRFWWAANRDNMPAWTVATAEFSWISPDYHNTAYDGLTSCFFPMSCGLGFGRCFDSIAIGNVAFNADYASLDGDPFVTPADHMRYWVDVQIGRPANAQCSVFVRMFRWDRNSNSLVNTEYRSSVPDGLALRGVALSMTRQFSGVWLVGFDKKVGRLVSYKVLPEMFEGDSYVGALSNNRLSLAKTGWHAAMGVHAPRYYGGTVVGEWCSLIQAN